MNFVSVAPVDLAAYFAYSAYLAYLAYSAYSLVIRLIKNKNPAPTWSGVWGARFGSGGVLEIGGRTSEGARQIVEGGLGDFH